MGNKKITITYEQFEELEYYRRMFELSADQIYNLCSEERSDIEYGFALGELHNQLRKYFYDMMLLEDKIKEANKL